MTSCTVEFTVCPSYYPPSQTIIAHYTWTGVGANCPSAGGNTYCALMVLRDPHDTNHASYFSGSSSGSHDLSTTVDETGTWDAIIQAWNGTAYVTATDTCEVSPPITVHLTLDDAGHGVCGATPPGCAPCYPPCCDYTAGTVVSLSATPDAGYLFNYWACDDGTYYYSTPWNKTINENITVIGYFKADPNYYKHLTLYVNGNGSISTSPACCDYPTGTIVTLTAIPDAGCSFINWTGTNNNNINPTTVTMNTDKSVTANFTQPNIYISPTSDKYFQPVLKNNCSPATDYATYRVTSDGNGNATTVISLADTNANQFQCTNLTLPYTWVGTPGTYLDVTIKFCPTSSGDKYAVLRFVCNPCPETYQVGLHGTGTDTPPPDPPCIGTTDPLNYIFANTLVDACSDAHAWQITNYGESTAFLVINWGPGFQITSSLDPDWWYDTGPIYWEIPAGGTLTCYARFCPTAASQYDSDIAIVCRNDIPQVACNLWYITGIDCGSSLTLHVTGTGVNICTAGIDTATVYNPGPANENTLYRILNPLSIKNTGTQTGKLAWKTYQRPMDDASAVWVPCTGTNPSGTSTNVTPGGTFQTNVVVMTPSYTYSNPDGNWFLGLKVWGEDENEPEWGSLGTIIFNSQIF
jgi:hypothetical protein